MAEITLCTYANLREFTGGSGSMQLEVQTGETIADVLKQLGIPEEQTRIVFVNHRAAELDYALEGGERVDLFSAIGGG